MIALVISVFMLMILFNVIFLRMCVIGAQKCLIKFLKTEFDKAFVVEQDNDRAIFLAQLLKTVERYCKMVKEDSDGPVYGSEPF